MNDLLIDGYKSETITNLITMKIITRTLQKTKPYVSREIYITNKTEQRLSRAVSQTTIKTNSYNSADYDNIQKRNTKIEELNKHSINLPSWQKLNTPNSVESVNNNPVKNLGLTVTLEDGMVTTTDHPNQVLSMISGSQMTHIVNSEYRQNQTISGERLCQGYEITTKYDILPVTESDTEIIPLVKNKTIEQKFKIEPFWDMQEVYVEGINQPLDTCNDMVVKNKNTTENVPRIFTAENIQMHPGYNFSGTNVNVFFPVLTNLSPQLINTVLPLVILKTQGLINSMCNQVESIKISENGNWENYSNLKEIKINIIESSEANISELINYSQQPDHPERTTIFCPDGQEKIIAKTIQLLSFKKQPYKVSDDLGTKFMPLSTVDYSKSNKLREINIITSKPESLQIHLNDTDPHWFRSQENIEQVKNAFMSLLPIRYSAIHADAWIVSEQLMNLTDQYDLDITVTVPILNLPSLLGVLAVVETQNYGLHTHKLDYSMILEHQISRSLAVQNLPHIVVNNTIVANIKDLNINTPYDFTIKNSIESEKISITSGALTSDRLYFSTYGGSGLLTFKIFFPGLITKLINQLYPLKLKDYIQGTNFLPVAPLYLKAISFLIPTKEFDMPTIFNEGYQLVFVKINSTETATTYGNLNIVNNILEIGSKTNDSFDFSNNGFSLCLPTHFQNYVLVEDLKNNYEGTSSNFTVYLKQSIQNNLYTGKNYNPKGFTDIEYVVQERYQTQRKFSIKNRYDAKNGLTVENLIGKMTHLNNENLLEFSNVVKRVTTIIQALGGKIFYHYSIKDKTLIVQYDDRFSEIMPDLIMELNDPNFNIIVRSIPLVYYKSDEMQQTEEGLDDEFNPADGPDDFLNDLILENQTEVKDEKNNIKQDDDNKIEKIKLMNKPERKDNIYEYKNKREYVVNKNRVKLSKGIHNTKRVLGHSVYQILHQNRDSINKPYHMHGEDKRCVYHTMKHVIKANCQKLGNKYEYLMNLIEQPKYKETTDVLVLKQLFYENNIKIAIVKITNPLKVVNVIIEEHVPKNIILYFEKSDGGAHLTCFNEFGYKLMDKFFKENFILTRDLKYTYEGIWFDILCIIMRKGVPPQTAIQILMSQQHKMISEGITNNIDFDSL